MPGPVCLHTAWCRLQLCCRASPVMISSSFLSLSPSCHLHAAWLPCAFSLVSPSPLLVDILLHSRIPSSESSYVISFFQYPILASCFFPDRRSGVDSRGSPTRLFASLTRFMRFQPVRSLSSKYSPDPEVYSTVHLSQSLLCAWIGVLWVSVFFCRFIFTSFKILVF